MVKTITDVEFAIRMMEIAKTKADFKYWDNWNRLNHTGEPMSEARIEREMNHWAGIRSQAKKAPRVEMPKAAKEKVAEPSKPMLGGKKFKEAKRGLKWRRRLLPLGLAGIAAVGLSTSALQSAKQGLAISKAEQTLRAQSVSKKQAKMGGASPEKISVGARWGGDKWDGWKLKSIGRTKIAKGAIPHFSPIPALPKNMAARRAVEISIFGAGLIGGIKGKRRLDRALENRRKTRRIPRP